MKKEPSWTRRRFLPEPLLVRKVLALLTLNLFFLGVVPTSAQADQLEVDNARAAFKTAVSAAVAAHKTAIAKAQSEYQQLMKAPADAVAVANAQAKILADQATKASQAKAALDAAMAGLNGDRKLRGKAVKDFDAVVRQIKQETEKALRDARALGDPKTARKYAKTLRDKAMKTAQENLTKALNSARAKLNEVLVANGLPPEKG